jgi:tRNA(adenine34) deaminase
MEEVLFDDEYFMRHALVEADKALRRDEVPIGAIIVANNLIIARAHNLTETLNDVTAHAEMQAITSAATMLGSKYLGGCTLYVTIEPCIMCAGALYWSQIDRIVYGAKDPKRGYSLNPLPLLHPRTSVVEGILENETGILLKEFFKRKRT